MVTDGVTDDFICHPIIYGIFYCVIAASSQYKTNLKRVVSRLFHN